MEMLVEFEVKHTCWLLLTLTVWSSELVNGTCANFYLFLFQYLQILCWSESTDYNLQKCQRGHILSLQTIDSVWCLYISMWSTSDQTPRVFITKAPYITNTFQDNNIQSTQHLTRRKGVCVGILESNIRRNWLRLAKRVCLKSEWSIEWTKKVGRNDSIQHFCVDFGWDNCPTPTWTSMQKWFN